MPRKPRQLPAQNTLPYLLLTLTALCGEYPIRQISHLPGGSAYLESVVTALRRDGLLRTFSKDGLRGLRLTSSAKRLLLADAPEWFSAYLTGSSEPNKLKSEIPRRLRLHRMAEILTIMHNADIPAFPWEKAPFSAASQSAAIPAYYTSREVKEIGPQGTKIKSSRATGILLTDGGIFLTYNTAKTQMKWEYKAELRFKALLQTEGVMPDAEISGIVFGSTMEQLSILATMLTAEIDFIVRGLDNTARSVVASRKAAMLRKRQTFYLDANEDGIPMIYEGRVVQARVIGVAEKVLRVEVFGVECTIFARDLSAAWFGDAREYYSVGDRVLVRVLTIDRDDINHISITADIRSVSSAANQSNLDKCVLQGKYAGRVTDVRHGVVFIRLNNGVNAVAHTCYDRRMPGKKDDVSFAVTRLDEERGIAVGIITRIIKQNL